MTLEEKNLILGVLRNSNAVEVTNKLKDSITERLYNLSKYLPANMQSEYARVEREFYELVDLLEWNYFDYGVATAEALESNLKWKPDFITENEKQDKVA